MALHTPIASSKGRITSLISASVLVSGLLLMALVSGASESSTASHAGPPVHAFR
jgi:hypothetical protein